MNIILISGVFDNRFFNPSWNAWGKEMKALFSGSKCIQLRSFYMWWETEKMEGIINRGVEILNKNGPTIVIGHSFGGILAKVIIDKTTNKNVKLVTMSTPHTYNILGLKKSKNKIHTPDFIEGVSSITFGGYLDVIVPYIFTKMTKAKHFNIFAGHLGFLIFKSVRKKVQRHIKHQG